MHSILQVTLPWTRKTQTIFWADIDETWRARPRRVVIHVQNVQSGAKNCVRRIRDLVINNSLLYNAFQLSVVKPYPKQLHQLITTDPDSSVNQSEFEVIACNRRQGRENTRVQLAIGFASYWLRKWREFCQPITEQSKEKPNQTRVTSDTLLKTA